jgi:putative membrane protein
MRSFNVGNTELMVMELLSLALPLIFLVLLFFLVRRAVSGGVRDAADTGGLNRGEVDLSAPEALDRRYARGEITREEYLTIKDDISREDDA